MDLLKIIIDLILGVVFLAWSADQFVHTATVVARKTKLPHFLIGMILVGFGTSLPELVVSIIAAIQGHAQLSVGNAIGSNIANIGLVLGVGALMAPLQFDRRLLKVDLPALLGVSVIVALFIADDYLARWQGVTMLLMMIALLYWLFALSQGGEARAQAVMHELEDLEHKEKQFAKVVLLFILSLCIVLASSEIFVTGATAVAKAMGVSDLFIGLTIVAIGTSLPELAVTVVCMLRKQYALAIGNVIGSNIFNLLAVMAMPAIISPGPLPHNLVYHDYATMLGFIILLWIFMLLYRARAQLQRWVGVVLVLAYASYIVLLIKAA